MSVVEWLVAALVIVVVAFTVERVMFGPDSRRQKRRDRRPIENVKRHREDRTDSDS